MSAQALTIELLLERPAPAASGLSRLLAAAWQGIALMSLEGIGAAGAMPAEGTARAAGSDEQDVRAAVGGDGDAYARLVQKYQQPIASYMWRFTRDRGRWEELVHDVFVEAYFSLRTYRGQAPLVHWLRRIATRVGYRFWKERARNRDLGPLPLHDQEAVAPEDAGQAEAQHAAQVVHATLQRLAPRDRLVLTLLYLEGSTVAGIAELTGWSQTMVKVQLHRARARLKRILESREDVL